MAFHFVCTLEEAKKIVNSKKGFWVSNCGCRERSGKCKASRMDVCLQFKKNTAASGSNKRKMSKDEIKYIFKEAKDKHLVPRPFRDEANMEMTAGICFCCPDCCSYFTGIEYICDKGFSIENTDIGKCTGCGICIATCYFNARRISGDKIEVNKENCFGCGICADVCPEKCIGMIKR